MKYSYTLILFVFALSFLSAQEPQEQKIETLLNNRILEKIDLNQELLTFDLKNFWKDSLVIDSSSNNPGLTELINYVELRRLLKENSQNDFLQFTTDVYEINNKNYKAALINFDAAIKLVPDFFIYHF